MYFCFWKPTAARYFPSGEKHKQRIARLPAFESSQLSSVTVFHTLPSKRKRQHTVCVKSGQDPQRWNWNKNISNLVLSSKIRSFFLREIRIWYSYVVITYIPIKYFQKVRTRLQPKFLCAYRSTEFWWLLSLSLVRILLPNMRQFTGMILQSSHLFSFL